MSLTINSLIKEKIHDLGIDVIDRHIFLCADQTEPPAPIEDQASIARGEDLYHWECHMCHGAGAVGGGVLADLRYMSAETHEKFNAITLGGLYVDKGMVGFASRLSEQDVEDIHAYLIQRANETYLFETINSALK